jgi:hypothetical protein
MSELITLTELANRLGKKKPQISRWKKQGKVVMVGDKVDYESTVNLLNLAKDPRGGKREKGSNGGGSQSVNNGVNTVNNSKSGGGGNSSASYYQARAFKENILAQKAALELKVQKGEYVSKEDEQKKGFELAMKLKDKFLSMPDRVAPIIAANSDQYEIRKILKDEIHDAILEFIENGGFLDE